MSRAGLDGPGRALLASSLLLCAGAARAADPENTMEAEVTATGSSDCGGVEGHGSTLTLSWKGPLRRMFDRPEDFHSGTGPRPFLSVTPMACGKCTTMAYDTSGELRVSASFFRFPDDATKFDVSISGIVCRSTIEMGGRCQKFQEDCVLTISTYDESPFALTRKELEAGFERHFTITGDGFVPGFDGVAQVTLRKGVGEPQVIVEGSHCACGADGTAEVTARGTSAEVLFEKFAVKGAPAGAVRRNEGGSVARVVLGSAARSSGPVEVVAVYRHRGKTRRAPPHLVHFALVEKPETKDNGIWGGNGGTDFVFDGSAPGHLEFEAEGRAWLDGRDASKSLRWVADAEYLRPDPAIGARTKFQGDGLPRDNASFGRKKLRAALQEEGCACESEPREVRLFYWRDAKNNPPGDVPNWAHYWAQTRAGQGVAFKVGKSKCGYDMGTASGSYDYCSDAIYLAPDKPKHSCRHPPGRASGNEGIDCFAQTLRHERHHQVELKAWWKGGRPDPVSADDPDGDLMPLWVEAQYGCQDGLVAGLPSNPRDIWAMLEDMAAGRRRRNTQFSCPVGTGLGKRPFDDVIDSEVNAYWVGWSWPTGSADDEDWARPGKNWPRE